MKSESLFALLLLTGGIAAAAEIPTARLPEAELSAYRPPSEQVSLRKPVVSAWDTIRAAAPVWPEAAAFPAWNRPVAVVLERIAETERVVREAASARLRGRTVIAAYSPAPGELLPDPAELAEALARLASLSDGFALAYHRSGAHVRTPSEGELAFLAAAVRSGNPGIALFGEAYFGELASGHRNRLSILSPPGASGVLLFNAARPTAVTSALIEEVARETALPVVLVVPDTFEEKYSQYQPRLVIEFDPQNN